MKKSKGERLEELEKRIETTYEQYEKLFDGAGLETSDINAKLEEVSFLIDHIDNRIHYTETRITRTVTFSVTLMAIGLALFAAIIKSDLEGLCFILGLISAGFLILTGGVAALIHVLQVNPRYPFRALPNDWKWFYPRIVAEKYKPKAFVKESEKTYLEKRLLHVEGLKEYAERLIEENPIERLRIDVQQLYLLHINEKYKNYFLTTLRRVLTTGLAIALIVLFALLIFVLAARDENHHNTANQVREKAVESIGIKARE